MSKYRVTITETLKMSVEVEADTAWEAEEMVSDRWSSGAYVLVADNFTDVSFTAKSVKDKNFER